MVKYKCGRCGHVFDVEEMVRTFGSQVRCPKCTYEILYKVARTYRIVRAI